MLTMCLRTLSVTVVRAPLAAILCLAFVGLPGCGGSRPDPTAVVKDGGDDDEAPPPAAKAGPADQQPLANTSATQSAPKGAAATQAAAATGPATAPFDTTYLPADGEFFVALKPGEIVRSSMTAAITGGGYSGLRPLLGLTQDIGLNFDKFSSITVGIRNLEDLPGLSPLFLAQGFDQFSVLRVASLPGAKPTIVLKSTERIDETDATKGATTVPYGSSRYYQLASSRFNAPCLYMPSWQTVVIADAASIRAIIDAGQTPPKPAIDLGFIQQSADIIIAAAPRNTETLRQWLPEPTQSSSSATTAGDQQASVSGDSIEKPSPESEPGMTVTVAKVDGGTTAPEPIDGTPATGEAPQDDPSRAGEQPDAAAANGEGEQMEDMSVLAVARRHAEAAALLINLNEGFAVCTIVRCDSPEHAAELQSAIESALQQGQASEPLARLGGGVQMLLKEAIVEQAGGLVSTMSFVGPQQQADLTNLPGFLIGLSMSNEPMAAATGNAPEVLMPQPVAPTIVWVDADEDEQSPDDLSLRAAARWDDPHKPPAFERTSQAQQPARPFRGTDDDDDRPRRGTRSTPGVISDGALRVVVEMKGPLTEAIDAVGFVKLTSIETDLGTELNFEGVRLGPLDAGDEFVATLSTETGRADDPDAGLQIVYHFTPPLAALEELTRLNGVLTLRIARQRTAVEVQDVADRVGKRLAHRDFARLGIVPVVATDDDRLLVRLLEGDDDQISALTAIDSYGAAIPSVTVETQDGGTRAKGRRVHVLTFANGIPPSVGLRFHVNGGVSDRDVPFRFQHVPVPPKATLPGF